MPMHAAQTSAKQKLAQFRTPAQSLPRLRYQKSDVHNRLQWVIGGPPLWPSSAQIHRRWRTTKFNGPLRTKTTESARSCWRVLPCR